MLAADFPTPQHDRCNITHRGGEEEAQRLVKTKDVYWYVGDMIKEAGVRQKRDIGRVTREGGR